MTDKQSLLAAIIAHPDEDTPRLAYADWLDEQDGDTNPLAEFIRVAIEFHRAREQHEDADNPYAQVFRHPLLERCNTLEKQAKSVWTKILCGRKGPLRGRDCSFHFGRGFPERASAPAERLIAEGDELFRLTPVRDLSVRNLNADTIGPLLTQPWMAHVRELSLDGQSATGPMVDWAVLALAPRLPSLSSLWLDGGSLNAVGASAFVSANPFPQLRKIHLSEVRLSSAIPALFGPKKFGQIEEVYLYKANATANDVQTIMNCPGLAGMTKLSLPSSPLSTAVIEALVSGKRWQKLRELVLWATNLPDDAFEVLADAPPASLRSLDLSMNRSGMPGFARLVQSRLMAEVRTLNLGSCPLCDAGTITLAQSPHLSNLRSLQLGGCGIGPVGAKALASSPALARLKSLSLHSNPITSEGAMAIAESPHLAGLEYLFVTNIRGKARQRLVERFGERVRF